MMDCTFQDVLEVTGARWVSGDPGRPLRGLSTDTRKLQGGELFLSLRGPNFDGDAFAAQALGRGAAGLILHEAPEGAWPPSVPLAEHPDPRRALGDLARWVRRSHRGHVIGITGSCGKTSTKTMLVQLLEPVIGVHGSPASFNNDVGVPLAILAAQPDRDAWVLELGTNAPGEIANLCRIAQPTGAIVTNIGEAHLAGLKSAAGVAREKGALVAGLGPEHFCVLNADCAYTPQLAASTEARVLTFGLDSQADLMARDLHFEGGCSHFTLTGSALERPLALRLPMLGSHMVQNLLAALAAVVGMGVPLDEVLAGVPGLQGAVRRSQVHRTGSRTIIDDSYNANPLSMAAGIRQLARMECAGQRILVAGDMLELGERAPERHREVGRLAVRFGLDRLVCVGTFADQIAAGAQGAGMERSRVLTLPDGEACVRSLAGTIQDGDVVLVKASRGARLDRLVEALLEREEVHEVR